MRVIYVRSLLTLLAAACADPAGDKGPLDHGDPPDTSAELDTSDDLEDSGSTEDCLPQPVTSAMPTRSEEADLPCDGSGWNFAEASEVDGNGYLLAMNGTTCDGPDASPVLYVYDVASWSVVGSYPYPKDRHAELGSAALLAVDGPTLAYQPEGESSEIQFLELGASEPRARVYNDSDTRISTIALRGDRVELGAKWYQDIGIVASFQGPLAGDVQWDDADAFIRSPVGELNGAFGAVLGSVGDVDGDGVDDLVMGSGEFWLLSGVDVVDGGEEHAKLIDVWHDESDGGYGPAGDIDGDGLGDVYVVARMNRDYDWGVVSFVGGQGGPAFAALVGDPVGAYAGEWIDTVGPIGDNDGDGHPEMFVAATYDAREPQHLRVVTAPACGVWSIGELGVEVSGVDDPGRFPFRAVGLEGFSAVLTWDEDGEDIGVFGFWWQ
jgi:hypothetical protein